MDILDYWHVKLAEECNEVAHRCAKTMQFGMSDIQNGHAKDNAQRLREEVLDLIAVVELMQNAGAMTYITVSDRQHAREVKRAKLQKYFKLSFELGRIEIGGPVAAP